MTDLRAATRAYLAALATVTAAVTILALLRTDSPELRDGLLAVAFCGLQVLAVAFPIALGPQQKLSLHTAVIFAAVLLFDPGVAVLIVGIGSLIGQTLRRQPADQVLFNSCQTALQAGLAGLLLTLFVEPGERIVFDRADAFAGALAAAVVIFAIDVVAVGIIVRLETDQPLLSLFQELPAGSLLDDLSQFALGLMTAIAVNAHAWILPIVLLLAYQMHRASRRSLAAQEHERHLRAESERTAHARQEFLLTASHELKTPITSIKMAAQLLDRGLIQRHPAFRVDQESILRWRDQLMLSVDRLENLVAELLDAARIQQGKIELHPEPLDLAATARAIVERFEIATERTRNHEIILETPDPVEGVWDPSRIDQVITNLVSNALKYSPNGGLVTVRVEQDADAARLIVTDNGIGISPEQQDELFKPFARALTIQHGISGTGLGLYITRQVVEQHGGTVTIASVPGVGTTMTVTLPCNPTGSIVAEPADAAATEVGSR
ncbi:MAG TPA: HAMP domain-containing sensor histidine kinase [Thermomicrobiales bacterium]|nr:HAMP domain-containing sensor histidine kinase [Thermomicrobiales bacterium]